MSLIKTYTEMEAEAFVPADYPCLRVHILFEHTNLVAATSGVNTLYDNVTGSYLTSGGTIECTGTPVTGGLQGWKFNSTATINQALPSAITVADGSFVLFSRSYTLLGGSTTAHAVQSIRNTTVANYQQSFTVNGTSVYDSTTATVYTSAADASSMVFGAREVNATGFLLGATNNTQCRRYKVANSSGLVYTATTHNYTGTKFDGPVTINQYGLGGNESEWGDAGDTIHDAQVWVFPSGVPADLQAALCWMATYNKPYPGWKDRT